MSSRKDTSVSSDDFSAADNSIVKLRLISSQVKRSVILTSILSVLLIVTLGWVLADHQRDTEVSNKLLSEAISVDIELVGLIKEMKLHVVQQFPAS